MRGRWRPTDTCGSHIFRQAAPSSVCVPVPGNPHPLIAGNAPRCCHNCGKYFLLIRGYNTCYRNNIAPGEAERTCRKVGAHRKEARAMGDRSLAQIEYDRTYNRLKQRKNRGKIGGDEWNTAVARAQTLLDQSGRGELTDEDLKRKLKEL